VHEGGAPIKYDSKGQVKIASEKKESRQFNNINYVMEKGITADFALVRAHTADTLGNLVFRYGLHTRATHVHRTVKRLATSIRPCVVRPSVR
jgi:acyl CoA:acetate/3-ketoacid CoA transferase alpha subunit